MEEKSCKCCCSEGGSKKAEDLIRDLINLINVYKEEEIENTTRIDPDTAEILEAKLKEIAVKVGEVCQCE